MRPCIALRYMLCLHAHHPAVPDTRRRYPIDTIKTRLQAVRGGGAIVWGGLYSGLAGNIAGVIPASALFMGVYEPVKKRMVAEGFSPFAAQFSAATLAGTAASLVRVPTEVVKQRMQTGQFTSAIAAVRAIVAKEGVRTGLYAGYGSFMLRDLPFDAIEFVAYEQMRLAYRTLVRGRELHPAETSACGAVAGVTTAILTTPLDVIKTRLMTQGTTKAYSGVLDCARKARGAAACACRCAGADACARARTPAGDCAGGRGRNVQGRRPARHLDRHRRRRLLPLPGGGQGAAAAQVRRRDMRCVC